MTWLRWLGDLFEATARDDLEMKTKDLFVDLARAQTMLRDFNRLRKAIRSHDSEATEAAWEKCERWVDQLKPNESAPDNLTIPDKRQAG